MNSICKVVLCFDLLMIAMAPVHAQENLARDLADHCKADIETRCHDVTPGDGRIIACLYTYADKLPDKCKKVVMKSSEQIRLISSAIRFVHDECRDDLEQFCKDIPPGEGRYAELSRRERCQGQPEMQTGPERCED